MVVTTAVIVVSEASRNCKCKQGGSGSSVGLTLASGSFHHIFFGRVTSISTPDSDDKQYPQMAYILASQQASFINFAGEPVSNEEVSEDKISSSHPDVFG